MKNGYKPIKWYKSSFKNRNMRTLGLLGNPCSLLLIDLKIRAGGEPKIPNIHMQKDPHMMLSGKNWVKQF